MRRAINIIFYILKKAWILIAGFFLFTIIFSSWKKQFQSKLVDDHRQGIFLEQNFLREDIHNFYISR